MNSSFYKSSDQLTILNGSMEYCVSKKRICKRIPFFKYVFSIEQEYNRIELDLDNPSFEIIIQWVYSKTLMMEMKSVIRLYNVADALMIKHSWKDDCVSYFHDNFTIEHLPIVIPQVTKKSKLLNYGKINSFICHHFLKISNTTVFLNYPIETIEYIMKLDLMITSEYQVFQAIIQWIQNDIDSRKCYAGRLFKHVRWSHMSRNDLAKVKETISSSANLRYLMCNLPYCKDNSSTKRVIKNTFISIYWKGNGQTIKLNVLNASGSWSPYGCFMLDNTISMDFFCDEEYSDILFDSSRKGVRIFWNRKKFLWLNLHDSGNTYFASIYRLIMSSAYSSREDSFFFEDVNIDPPDLILSNETLLLESDGQIILVGKTFPGKKFFGLFPVKHHSWFMNFEDYRQSFHATVLDNKVYIITRDIEFIEFNPASQTFKKTRPFEEYNFKFEKISLSSQQTNDYRVLLMDQISKKIFVYDINSEKWSLMGQLVDTDDIVVITSAAIPSSINPTMFIKKEMQNSF